jgi:antitoxin CptB
MIERTDTLRKRVLFRSHHTGMQENDLLLGAFAERKLATMSDADVNWFESLMMENNDIDLYNWMMKKQDYPPEWDHPVLRSLIDFVQNFRSST